MKKRNNIWAIGLTILCLFFCTPSLAQENIKEELPTGKVNRKVDDNQKAKPKNEKTIRFIYVKSGKNLLIGNPCALEVTRNMGFEYELQHRPDDSFHSNWQRFWNNTGVKSKLFFTKGPGWKSKVNKKIKQCAIQSGDFRG
ncbi:MAG: hypothetical protein JXR07_07040 [Reichenbachiella sp.]